MEIVKIRTKKNRIITLTVSEKTNTHIIGEDKYGKSVKLPFNEIDSMIPREEP